MAQDFIDYHELRVFELLPARRNPGGPHGREDQHRNKPKEVPRSKSGVFVQQNRDYQRRGRAYRAGRRGRKAAAEPRGQQEGEARQSWSSSPDDCGADDETMVYFSLAQLPRSMSRHRSLQKGI